MTITAILSVGMVLVIVATHIDLSVGKLAGYVSVVVAYFQANTIAPISTRRVAGANHGLSVLVGLAVGTLYGVVQGVHHRLSACARLHRDAGQHVDPHRA